MKMLVHPNAWRRGLQALAATAAALLIAPAGAEETASAPAMKTIATDRARIAYIETGDPAGRPILFLHGIPSSSYLWRNILPGVAGERRRLIAMDLVGFGRSTGEGYAVLDQVKHLDAFAQALDLDDIILVTHDWGAGIGLIWASQNPGKIEGFATMEGALPPVYPRPDLDSFGKSAPLFKRMRDPVEGRKAILEENVWVETIMPNFVAEPLSKAEMDAYREPFLTRESRIPILDMTQSLPIGGEPADVVAAFDDAVTWWKQTELPKLVLYGTPGRLLKKEQADWANDNLRNVETVNVGPGVHFLQEDSPAGIATALDAWLDKLPPNGS